MKSITANSVSAALNGMKSHSFGTAIVQKRTPGAYTYEFGSGSLAIEAVVSFLLTDTKKPGNMQANVDKLSDVLLDNGKLKAVWNRLFPSPHQTLTPNQHLFSTNDSQREFAAALGAKAVSGITATMNEILVEFLSATRFVSASEGYSFREMRLERFPTKDDLAREFVRAELIAALRGEPIRARIDATKFSPAFLFDEFRRKCNKLGRALAKIGYNYDDLHDAMYTIYTGLNDRGSLHSRLPREVVNSGEFAELSANLTFVAAAYAAAPTRSRGPEYNLRPAMSKVIQLLNLSDRYEITSLATAAAHCRYTPVVDPRSNLLGGVLSFAAPIKHAVDIALIHQHSGTSIPLLQATKLDRYTESFSALITPVNGWDVMADAHAIVESIVSVGRISELDENPRSTLWCVDTLHTNDLIHLAVLHADEVYLPKVTANGDAGLDQRFIFEKDLKGKRLFADEIPFEGRVHTADAATLLLCCDGFRADLPYDMSGQFTPDFVWDTLIVNSPEEILWDFSETRDLDVQVGGTTVKATVSLIELTRQIERDSARMLAQPFTAPVIGAAFQAIHDAYDWVAAQPYVASNPATLERLRSQVSHQIASLYDKLGSSPMFEESVNFVVRRLAKAVPPSLRDETYMTLEQMHYRLQISTALVGFIYENLQLLDKAGEDGVSIHNRNMTVLREADYFNRMIGAARARRVTV